MHAIGKYRLDPKVMSCVYEINIRRPCARKHGNCGQVTHGEAFLFPAPQQRACRQDCSPAEKSTRLPRPMKSGELLLGTRLGLERSEDRRRPSGRRPRTSEAIEALSGGYGRNGL